MQTSRNDHFQEQYKTKTTPWDIGRPDSNLIDIVNETPIDKCKALDIGCGYGYKSIWLTQQGFSVIGVDISEIAIDKAKKNASKDELECKFQLLDFIENDISGFPFGFVFDRGCFHAFRSDEERRKFADRVAHHLSKDGSWFSIIGNIDEYGRGSGPAIGPPRLSAKDIVTAVEPVFEIISLTTSNFDSNRDYQPKAWACLMKKRLNR